MNYADSIILTISLSSVFFPVFLVLPQIHIHLSLPHSVGHLLASLSLFGIDCVSSLTRKMSCFYVNILSTSDLSRIQSGNTHWKSIHAGFILQFNLLLTCRYNHFYYKFSPFMYIFYTRSRGHYQAAIHYSVLAYTSVLSADL